MEDILCEEKRQGRFEWIDNVRNTGGNGRKRDEELKEIGCQDKSKRPVSAGLYSSIGTLSWAEKHELSS